MNKPIIDENLFEQKYHMYAQMIKNISNTYLKSNFDSEDAVQEVFLKYLNNYHKFINKNEESEENVIQLLIPSSIKVLKQSRDSLIELSKHDITYGDVTEVNILYNRRNKTVKLCDIDNIRIGNLPIDAKGYTLQKYYSLTGTIDEKTDAYMHNILTLKSLSYDYSTYDTSILVDLRRGIYPTSFKQTAKPILDSLNDPNSFSGEYIPKAKTLAFL